MRDAAPHDDLREMDMIVLRHCEKAGDGLSDPLTLKGAQDAERLAARLAREEVDAVFASPYRRSRETIAPFARAAGREVIVDGRLAEWRVSAAALAEIDVHGPRVIADPHYRAPWSETAAECFSRVAAALRDIRASGARRPLLACHGGILGFTLLHLADAFGEADWISFHQPTAVALHRGAWRRLGLA